jgi:type I restriction enzyme R subunit
MYLDKPMRGHTLMQAIARVNRVFLDKPGGLIVDYLGIAADLKRALAFYADSGGKGTPTDRQEDAVKLMLEKLEIVEHLFDGFDYRRYFKADTAHKLSLILQAEEHILGLTDGKERFTKEVTLLSQAFALSIPHEQALAIKEHVAFFQAVRARLQKFEPIGAERTNAEIETAIRQVVDRAIVSDQIIDIFDAAGIQKPEISILSDEFLEDVRGMPHQHLALELLRKLLNDEIKSRTKTNLVQSKALMEMLENAIKRYQNHILTATQVINELIELAKDIKASDQRGEQFGLSVAELAFYDALANNESAREVLGDEKLRESRPPVKPEA